jgi:hypothetical protein
LQEEGSEFLISQKAGNGGSITQNEPLLRGQYINKLGYHKSISPVKDACLFSAVLNGLSQQIGSTWKYWVKAADLKAIFFVYFKSEFSLSSLCYEAKHESRPLVIFSWRRRTCLLTARLLALLLCLNSEWLFRLSIGSRRRRRPSRLLWRVVFEARRCHSKVWCCNKWLRRMVYNAAARYELIRRYYSGVVSRLCIRSLHAVVTVLFHARLNTQEYFGMKTLVASPYTGILILCPQLNICRYW